MNHIKQSYIIIGLCLIVMATSCKIPQLAKSPEMKQQPATFPMQRDTVNTGFVSWRNFFTDPHLVSLIDTALQNNQELAITLQEIEMARNDIGVRQSLLRPKVEAGGGLGIEKVGRYTSQGAGDASTDITPGKAVPDWLGDFRGAAVASWEIDIWKKLRNAKQAAVDRYLATIEGKNFLATNLIGEIAAAYYELLALDDQLNIIRQNINVQTNALEIVKAQKLSGAATDLAVKKFEAEVLSTKAMEKDVMQQIQSKENELNMLTGRYPQPIERSTEGILKTAPLNVSAGIPSQLLSNRPDIKQAELSLAAAKLDVNVAKAEFYPSFNINAGLGLQAFNPAYLVKFPESMLTSLAGEIAGPLINKAAIKAEYANANARQIQALYAYEKNILKAYTEVSTEMSNLNYYNEMYQLKSKETDTLIASVNIANDLFRSARADYLEVLLTQRDALESKLELTEIRLKSCITATKMYRALGGGK